MDSPNIEEQYGRYQIRIISAMTLIITDFQITLALTSTRPEHLLNERFVVFDQEIFSCYAFLAYDRERINITRTIISQFTNDFEISNPVELAAELGGTIFHETFMLPKLPKSSYS
jgi:hypothetical protein